MKKVYIVGTALQLFCLFAALSVSSVFAQTDTDIQATTKLKAKVQEVGTGQVVTVWLKDKKKLIGNITQINSDNFILKESEGGTEQTINYNDVKQFKRGEKRDLSTGFKALLIGVGVLYIIGMISNGGG